MLITTINHFRIRSVGFLDIANVLKMEHCITFLLFAHNAIITIAESCHSETRRTKTKPTIKSSHNIFKKLIGLITFPLKRVAIEKKDLFKKKVETSK